MNTPTTTEQVAAKTAIELQPVYERWTVELLERMPNVIGEHHEIIDGKLFVTTQPHHRHQLLASRFCTVLQVWADSGGTGVALGVPGVILAVDTAVVPDVVWMSNERYSTLAADDGKLHGAPDLVVEVLSPGKANEERDRDTKVALYNEVGVCEYWLADWRSETIEVYRRRSEHEPLVLFVTLTTNAILTSPLLPDFTVPVANLFRTVRK